MARQKDQKMRFSDSELLMFKTLFAENEDLLFTIRKAMLQFELSDAEKKSLKDVMTEQVHALLKKTFSPDLDPDAPIFQLTDMKLGLAADMKSKGVEEMWPFIQAKEVQIAYFDQQIAFLKDFETPIKIVLADMAKDLSSKTPEQAFIDIHNRNYILSYVDSNLQQVIFLAGQKTETVEETKTRLAKNSSK